LALGRAAGRARRRAHRATAAGSGAAAVSARHRAVGARPAAGGELERFGGVAAAVRADVLDGGAATGAPDRQRRLAAEGRPVRVWAGIGTRRRPARLAARTELERRRTGHARRRVGPILPRGWRRRHDAWPGARGGRRTDRLRRPDRTDRSGAG